MDSKNNLDLQQILNQVLSYVKAIWIKKRYVIICSWLLCPIGFFYVLLLEDTYSSRAEVFVDTRSVLQPLLRGLAIQTDKRQEVQLMARTLLSRENVEKIAREVDLDLTTNNEREFDSLVQELTRSIGLRGTGRDNMYTISYRSSSAALAQNVVQKTLDLFVEDSLGNNRKGTDTADRFLNEQIAEYETRLAEDEQRLADFKRQYSDIIPVQGSFYSNLSSQNTELETIRLEIEQKQQQVESMRSQIQTSKNKTDGFDVSNNDASVLKTRYDERIKALEARIDELKLRFTDLHPDVIESTNLLESLQQSRQKEIDEFLASPNDVGIPLSPLSSQIRLEMSILEGEIASLKVKEANTEQKIRELESKIDLIPQIEAEAKALNRDYGITQSQYESLLQRKESADLSKQADLSSEDIQFRIIKPPNLPNKPSDPNRLIYYTAVLIAGFAVGIGLAFLMSQLSPVLVKSIQLQSITEYPILGSVTHLNIEGIQKSNKFRLLGFIVSSGCIVGMYAVLVLVDILNIDLVTRLGL